ncbi:HNH endonuclease [Bacillus paranthracis]|uniref:HNH endonuclease n=1 Tax=Bacillus paranthracis TaxID=2026186 RepID=UPI0021CFD140|nr:HNH endonuclease [Bacillus paranthracis]MCU5172104.1 HNH endonuclease [Bacillus paranthracis]
MRPVFRGDVPVDENNNPITFKHYSQARGYLKERIGAYCSYCERKLEFGCQVEHIHPKSKRPDRECDWTNFLIACPNCNPIKNDKEIVLSDYVWPDLDNTFEYFLYLDGFVFATDITDKSKAEAMIKLVGLDRISIRDLLQDSEQTDERQFYRLETWNLAQRYYEQLYKADTEETRQTIVDLAIARGYWSVWMTIFKEDKDIINRLVSSFSGTKISYFK